MKLEYNNLKGAVAIVGAGPGDPELLTLRAHRLLARADVVLCDRLVHADVLDVCRRDVRVIDVGKNPNGKKTSQDVIHHLLAKEARSGHFVVRLKGGDPFVFGRGGEEALYLAERDIPFEIVAGVSSSVSVPAAAGIPVTHRGVSTHFTVVTGMGKSGPNEQVWEKLGPIGGTLVILMGVRQLPNIADALVRGGRSPETPAAIVHRGTTEHQIVVEAPLDQLAARAAEVGVESPAVVVVGDVVALRDRISSREPGWHALDEIFAARA